MNCHEFIIEKGIHMNRRKVRPIAGNPLLIWNRLALKTNEMIMASAQVINHRTGRIAAAGLMPNEVDRHEFRLMGQEKIDAIAESLQAIGLRVLSAQQQLGVLMLNQVMTSTTSWMTLAGSRTLEQTSKLQGDMMRDVISNAAAVSVQLGDSLAKVVHKGLMPLHSPATANANRLAKLT
jgi:hypothetical protein